jgi:hypothetical protein
MDKKEVTFEDLQETINSIRYPGRLERFMNKLGWYRRDTIFVVSPQPFRLTKGMLKTKDKIDVNINPKCMQISELLPHSPITE